jgi:DNA-binding MarR family transcriptional regulator
VERSKRNCGRISVFKGREAKLNFAVFHVLALKGPQTIYDIHKEVKAQRGLRQTRYASVNKRVRFLEESGYIKKTGIKKTKAGFEASTYELATKAYLAILLNSVSLEELLTRLDETAANLILADITRIIGF